jgi:ribosomal subunit interface protein
MSLRLNFHQIPTSDTLRTECEDRVRALQEEFPETTRFEVTVAHNGTEHEAHVHLTGKDVELAAHARGHDVRTSLEEALEKARRQLRKHHDKQIFARRRI